MPDQGDLQTPSRGREDSMGDAVQAPEGDALPPLPAKKDDIEPQEQAAAGPTGPMLLILMCGGEEYGIPVEQVREVVEAPQVTRVPLAPKHVAGVAAVRGDILPVVDLGERLHARPTVEAIRMVTVDAGEMGRVGLLADDVVGMIQASSVEAIDPVPPDAAGSLPPNVASGVYAPSDDRVVVLLNLGPLLAIDIAAKER
ncbi:MAG TPA: chemotaxis protein CheW [Longimicrobiales bacterium]|nr:chemotaxis protein CheW [Longimicrobiales bacterium]